MIALPFVWFAILFIYIYRRRGFDVSAFITLLYVVSSAFSIFMYQSGFIDPQKQNISVVTGLIYCVLISLIIYPTYKLNSKNIEGIVVHNTKVVDYITYAYFAYFLFILVTQVQNIYSIFVLNDWTAMRYALHQGYMTDFYNYSGVSKYLYYLFFIFLSSNTYVMIPIFFISICYLDKPKWFSVIALISSTTTIMEGILHIDRSWTFRWLLFLALNVVFFWPLLSNNIKRRIMPLLGITTALVLGYMITVTKGRFNDNTQVSTNEGVVSYAGQSYVNFCYFFDNFNNHEGFKTIYYFPWIHQNIIKDYEGNTQRQAELTVKSGIECGVFYSVLGTFILDGNQIGPFIFVIIYLLIFNTVLRGIGRGSLNLVRFFGIYYFILIPTFGIIAYTYTQANSIMNIIVFLLVVNYFEKRTKRV